MIHFHGWSSLYFHCQQRFQGTHLEVKWGTGLWSQPQSKGSDIYWECTIHLTWRLGISWLILAAIYLYGSASSHIFIFLHASPLRKNIFSMWCLYEVGQPFNLPLIVNCSRTWFPSTKCLELAMETALASVFLAGDLRDCQCIQGHSGVVLYQWDLPLLHPTWDKHFVYSNIKGIDILTAQDQVWPA